MPASGASGDLKEALDELGDSWALTTPIKKRLVWPWVVGAAGAGLLVIVVLIVLLAGGGGAPPNVARPAAAQPAAAPASPAITPRAPPSRPKAVVQVPSPAMPPRPPSLAEAPGTVTPEAARPGLVQALPTGSAPAPTEGEAPSGSAVPAGAVQGAAAAQLDGVVKEWLFGLMSPDAAGVAAMRPGRRVEMKRGARRYLGVIYRRSTVLVAHSRVDVKELYAMTTNAWQLSEDFYLPAQTCIIVRNGAYEVMSLAALKAATAEEEAYIRNALAEIDAAVEQQDLERAQQVLAEARAKFQDSIALEKRAAALRVELNSVLIRVENRAVMPLSLRLVQGGMPAVDRTVAPGETVAIKVFRGLYLGEWRSPTVSSDETVTVDRSQTWVFTLGGGAAVAGMEGELRWMRTAR